jgi:hypothetical protein
MHLPVVMAPVRWYHLLSTWIFILSCIPGLPTFPLNLLAAPGCFEVIINPKEHWVKNAYIIFIHVAPFFWVTYDLSPRAFMFAAAVIVAYLAFMAFIGKSPLKAYSDLLKEDHNTLSQFLGDRFMIKLSE